MKPYIIKNSEFLKYFSKLPQRNKIQLIPALNRNQLNTISEICKNFLSKNLTTCPKIIRKVKPSKKEIKSVSLKKKLHYIKRKKFYNQGLEVLFYLF